MSVAVRAISRLQDADDVNVTLGVGVDEYALTWDNDTARFVLRAPIAGLLATGATTGATSQAQAFTNGIIGPSWKPSSNSTTALQLQNATGTAVITVDTTNGRVKIGGTPEGETFAVNGNIQFASGGSIGYRISSNTTIAAFRNFSSALSRIYTGYSGAKLLFVSEPSGGTDIASFDGVNYRLGVGVMAPATTFHTLLTSAATNTVTNVVTIGHDTSGTSAAGFGAGQLFTLESSTTAAQSAARIQALWYEATHATRKADLVLTAYDTAEREGLRIRGNGSAPAIGFLGATPQARIAHLADANVAYGAGDLDTEAEVISAINTTNGKINSILATLELFGFHATS